MCLACKTAEGNTYAKNEKQVDYSASQDHNSSESRIYERRWKQKNYFSTRTWNRLKK